MNNVSVFHFVIGYCGKIFDEIKMVLQFKKHYKNYLHVIRKYRKREFPIEAVLTNGKSVDIKNRTEVLFETSNAWRFFKIDGDHLIIKKDDFNDTKFIDWIDNGDLIGVFINEDYKMLSVKDKIVLDIGANIGDSSVYFAKKGAQKVIAVEPFLRNFVSLKNNILINGMENKIIPIHSGCGGSTRIENIEDENARGIGLEIKNTGDKQVQITALSTLLEELKGNRVILKMDCEGCEYDTIHNTPISDLGTIDEMILEYHDGYVNLKNRLERAGFHVNLKDVRTTNGLSNGILFAKKR